MIVGMIGSLRTLSNAFGLSDTGERVPEEILEQLGNQF